jgi:hypothetical protein
MPDSPQPQMAVRIRPWVQIAWLLLLGYLCYRVREWEPSEALFLSAVASAVLGAAVTLFPKLTDPLFKTVVFSAFVAAAWIGADASYRASKESDSTAASTKTKVEGIDKIVADVHTATLENSRMNRQTLDAAAKIVAAEAEIKTSSAKIEQLAIDAIRTQTGGDSYMYLVFDRLADAEGIPVFKHSGKFPLYRVYVRIWPLDAQGREFMADGKLLTESTLQEQNKGARADTHHLGDITPGENRFTDMADVGSETRLRVQFAATNGSWTQEYRRAKVGAKWYQAFRVTRSTPKPKKKVCEWVEPGFPKEKLDWFGEASDVSWPAPSSWAVCPFGEK